MILFSTLEDWTSGGNIVEVYNYKSITVEGIQDLRLIDSLPYAYRIALYFQGAQFSRFSRIWENAKFVHHEYFLKIVTSCY